MIGAGPGMRFVPGMAQMFTAALAAVLLFETGLSLEMTGVSPTTLWRMVQTGAFPAPAQPARRPTTSVVDQPHS